MGTTDNPAANTAVKNLKSKSVIPAQAGTQSPLSGSVGIGGENKPDDVFKVSEALVANGRLDQPTSDATDAFNSKIITAQQDMDYSLRPDGLVKPGGPTEQKFTHLVSGGKMKAPAVPTPKNRAATGTRAGNAAVTATTKQANVDDARAEAMQNAGDTTRTSFQQAQDVKRLNKAKADAAAAQARAERADIKARAKAQHDQIMAAQEARQQTAKHANTQSEQMKTFASKLAQNIGNLLQDRASPEHHTTRHPRAGGDPSLLPHTVDPDVRRGDGQGDNLVPSVTDEVFAANRRSAQYLASLTDMQEFPRWEVEDINILGAPAIAKTADLIEQTHDLAPDQAKHLYERVIIGINPDAQDELDQMLGQKPLGTQWGIVNHAKSLANEPEAVPEQTERPKYAKERKQRREATGKRSRETRLNAKEGFLRGGAKVGDAIGLDRSAEYLRHFLDGSGQDIVVPRDEARKDPFIRESEVENQQRFEEQTFLGKTKNSVLNDQIRTLKDDQTISFSDKWDKELSFFQPQAKEF